MVNSQTVKVDKMKLLIPCKYCPDSHLDLYKDECDCMEQLEWVHAKCVKCGRDYVLLFGGMEQLEELTNKMIPEPATSKEFTTSNQTLVDPSDP